MKFNRDEMLAGDVRLELHVHFTKLYNLVLVACGRLILRKYSRASHFFGSADSASTTRIFY